MEIMLMVARAIFGNNRPGTGSGKKNIPRVERKFVKPPAGRKYEGRIPGNYVKPPSGPRFFLK
jgi:hypothetical protein